MMNDLLGLNCLWLISWEFKTSESAQKQRGWDQDYTTQSQMLLWVQSPAVLDSRPALCAGWDIKSVK